MIDLEILKNSAIGWRDEVTNSVRKLREDGKYNLSTIDEMMGIVKKTNDWKTAYVAIQETVFLLARIEESRLSANIIRIELKNILGSKEFVLDGRHSGNIKTIRDCYGKICDYSELLKEKFEYIRDVMWALQSINAQIRAGRDNMTYNYGKED